MQRVVFCYELARRTPTGRAQKWPRWDKAEMLFQRAFEIILRENELRLPFVFDQPAAGYHALAYSHPFSDGGPVYFDLGQPIDVLKYFFEELILELRTVHKIEERPKAVPQTQAVAWNWLQILDSKKQLNAPERSIKSRALAKGQSFVEAVARCFEDPSEVLYEHLENPTQGERDESMRRESASRPKKIPPKAKA